MNTGTWVVVAAALLSLPLVSYFVEWLRKEPVPPERLPWVPDVPVQYVRVGQTRVRYITTGQGPALVLLHTLRTQLDMFQRIVPALARRFRVYALDYPGHGYSEIPATQYTPDYFVASVAGFLDALNITNAVVVGESIGGSIALLLGGRHDARVAKVVAVNPYDYGAGRGLRRSSTLANILLAPNNVPILGATITRLRSFLIIQRVFEGGVYRKGAMPAALAREMYAVGNRRGHYQAFMSLVRHWAEWEAARREYGSITVPVLLVYGDHDWSRVPERTADHNTIPGAQMVIVKDAGHFLALDAPDELVKAITDFTR